MAPIEAIFIDDGDVMNDNARRGPQWQRLVGEYLAPRLGGDQVAWGRANKVIAEKEYADQTVTIRLNAPDRESLIARRHRRVLERFGGTAGLLLGGTGLPLTPVRWVYRGVDAVIYSLHNELERA